ncbi:MAG: glycosyltransferase family 39 protein [Anaerolineae bacterium]
MYRIDHQSLWLDELFSVFLARRGWADIVAGTAQDSLPPLYYFLLHPAISSGANDLLVRLGAAFFSILTIPLLYSLAITLFDVQTALASAWLLALNPFHILFAQEARMYTLLALFSVAASFFFWRAWIQDRPRDWVLFSAATALAFYTHTLAFLNLLALDLFALSQVSHLKRRWRTLLVANTAVGILYLPWMVAVARQLTHVATEFSAGNRSPLSLVSAIYLFLFGQSLPAWAMPIALAIGLTLLAFILLAVRYHSSALATYRPLWFAAFVFFVPVLGLYLISLAQPLFVERRLLPASLGLLLLLAWGIAHARPRRLNKILGVALVSMMLVTLPNYYFNPAVQKIPMREVAERVAAQWQPGDVIIHTSDTSALAFAYYRPELPGFFLAGDPDYENLTNRGRAQRIAGLNPVLRESVVTGARQVWLIVTLDHQVDYQRARVAEFDTHCRRVDHQNISGVDVLLYHVSEGCSQ